MKYIYLLFLASILFASKSIHAQLLDNSPKFTRADSLRGMLTSLRSCFDVKYYHLDVKIDPFKKSIEGSNTIYFNVINPFTKFQIDLFENLKINKILFKGGELKFTREFNAVFVEFPQTLKEGSSEEIKVFYSGLPVIAKRAPWDGGFVWTSDKNGSPWIGVACQGVGASLWWPNKDHLSDEPDSMMISVTVPKDLMDVSNGRLRKEAIVDINWKRFDWFVSYPINNYNVTVNIAKYAHWRDYHVNEDTLTLDYYVLPNNIDKAKKQFEQVKPMMTCFEKYLGKYPFYRDGFKLVETPYLGMEHQSAIAYGNKYLTGYSGKDISAIGLKFDYILIHETGHEWWGNNVSCADLADMWIHESLCTYSEALYVECIYGYKTALEYINTKKPSIQNEEPIIGVYGVNNEGPADMYNKGLLFFNTLRSIIDDDNLWFDILKGMQKELGLKTTSEAEIVQYVNKRTGRDFTYFFDQYVKNAKIPVLELKFEKIKGRNIIKYKWKSDVKDFNMPVKVTLSSKTQFEIITPMTSWQEKIITIEPKEVKVATDLYYVDVSIVE